MAELWGRSARLTFGVPGELGIEVNTINSVGQYTVPQIEFNINKSIKAKNTAEISIYNLNSTSREIVSSAKSG